MRDSVGPQRIPSARFAWLEQESARWLDAGLVDETSRARIVAAYGPQSAARRGMLALVVLAALMVGIGVLLLIGYNWARLGALVKVAMTMSGVAAAFAASAIAYSRRRMLAGETLALIGTFAFANSIWLIAQVLHIQGHFPDGFMWSAVGALAAAVVVRSRWIGVEAAIFGLVWVAAAGIAPPHAPALPFLAFAPVAIGSAYYLRSPVMLRITAFACALWVAEIDPDRIDEDVLLFAAVVLLGSAFYTLGTWHRTDVVMRRAWQSTGLVVLIIGFAALLTTAYHVSSKGGVWWTPAAIVALASALVTASLVLVKHRSPAENAVAIVAGALTLWAALLTAGVPQLSYLWVTTFSALAVLMSTSLIQTALRTDDAAALTFGVVFGLEFIFVRWASVVENMLWSGLMLLLAGGGLLLVARLWFCRDRQLVAPGRLS